MVLITEPSMNNYLCDLITKHTQYSHFSTPKNLLDYAWNDDLSLKTQV